MVIIFRFPQFFITHFLSVIVTVFHVRYDTEKVLDEHDRRASGIRRYNPWGYSKVFAR